MIPGAARRPQLRISFDLPTAGEALTILDRCSRPIRLSEIEPLAQTNLIVRVALSVEQRDEVYLALIGCLIAINRWARSRWLFPPLYSSGVRYVEEDPGREVWQSMPALYLRGQGDCEDLVAARAAEIPNAEPRMIITGRSPSGGRLLHFQVKKSDGSIEDPSRILGMR